MARQPRVLIADERATRAGLRLVLEGEGFTVCAEASDAVEALRLAERTRPDLCLVGFGTHGETHIAARFRRRVPETKVIMLAPQSESDDDLLDALSAGASGYLARDIEPALLSRELRAVLNGEYALCRASVARLVDEVRRQDQLVAAPLVRRHDAELTRREWEVLELMREPCTTAEIALRLGISSSTVRRHIGSILRKLDVPDRLAAVRLLDERDAIDERGRSYERTL